MKAEILKLYENKHRVFIKGLKRLELFNAKSKKVH